MEVADLMVCLRWNFIFEGTFRYRFPSFLQDVFISESLFLLSFFFFFHVIKESWSKTRG